MRITRRLLKDSEISLLYEELHKFIGSSNPKVASIARGLKFKEIIFWNVPLVIKFYLLGYFLNRLNPTFLADAFRKRLHTRNKYHYFIKDKYTAPERIKITPNARIE